MKEIFEIENLTLSYDKTCVLWDVNIKMDSSQLVGIIGPNGAGKSTFLKAVLGIVKPISGTIRLWGQSIEAVRKKIAYVPQKESIDWDFPITAYEVVLMGRYHRMGFLKKPRNSDKMAAMEALDRVGMKAFAKRQIAELSGGQQQRLFLARALVQDAEMYFMDEPFQCVDISTEKTIMDLLRELKKAGKTIFVVHHDISTLREYFDSLILFNTSLIAYGPTTDVLTKQNIKKAFSKAHVVFDETTELSSKKIKGLC